MRDPAGVHGTGRPLGAPASPPAAAEGGRKHASAEGRHRCGRPVPCKSALRFRVAGCQGSSTLLVTLVLLLLSGACLALLMATQTRMLIASRQKVQVRLLAAAEGGVELAAARGIAGAADPYARALGATASGAGILVETSGFVPMASGACDLCMANLEISSGGLKRVSHAVSASASAPGRSDGLPPPRRAVSATVDLAPWPAAGRDRWDLAAMRTAARRLMGGAGPPGPGVGGNGVPVAVVTLAGEDGAAARTVAVGGVGSALHAVEVSPRPGPLWTFVDASDADGNDAPDLGPSLAPPAIAAFRFSGGIRALALFGGGHDPGAEAMVGNWLYMVDIDSGDLLYKRELDAPATATPAVVDLTGDGVADRVYAATLDGSLYRVDVSAPARLAGGRVAFGHWPPLRVFETGGLPIRHPPASVPVPELGLHALVLAAAGEGGPPAAPALPPAGPGPPPTGPGPPATGRIVVLVDRGAGSLANIDRLPRLDPANPVLGVDRLAPTLPPSGRGWSLALAANEGPASPPLVFGGLVVLLTVRPAGAVGEVRSYSLWLGSGDAADGTARSRTVAIDAPWPPPADLGLPARIDVDHPASLTAPLLSPAEDRIVEGLRARLPDGCRFNGVRIRLAGVGPHGEPLRLATLPVCRIDRDWTFR